MTMPRAIYLTIAGHVKDQIMHRIVLVGNVTVEFVKKIFFTKQTINTFIASFYIFAFNKSGVYKQYLSRKPS